MSVMENKSMSKLNDEDLEQVSGGIIFNAWDINGADENRYWEVLDDHNGTVLSRVGSKEEAISEARRLGQNRMRVNWDQVQELRN